MCIIFSIFVLFLLFRFFCPTDQWYGMLSVKDFIIEILVGCSSEEVREVAYHQFTSLINMTTPAELSLKKFLTQVQHLFLHCNMEGCMA